MIPQDRRLNYVVNLLSSSINESALNRAKAYKSVNQFLNKPLTRNALENMLAAV